MDGGTWAKGISGGELLSPGEVKVELHLLLRRAPAGAQSVQHMEGQNHTITKAGKAA